MSRWDELGVAAGAVIVAAIVWTPVVIAYMAISGAWESTAAVKASFLIAPGVGVGYFLRALIARRD